MRDESLLPRWPQQLLPEYSWRGSPGKQTAQQLHKERPLTATIGILPDLTSQFDLCAKVNIGFCQGS